jgi:predicted RNase H-like nuclease (RuvC/YqgF family)
LSVVVKKYEEMIESMNKENKRLQNSLKEMVTANKGLRQQVISCNDRTNPYQQKLTGKTKKLMSKLHNSRQLLILIQERDRNERLKSTVAQAKKQAAKPVAEAAAQADMFQQMKKMILSKQNNRTGTFQLIISVHPDDGKPAYNSTKP